MEAVDVGGLHPSLAATVILHAARNGQPVSGIAPAARRLAEVRDALGASVVVESNQAAVHLSGPDEDHRLMLARGDDVLTLIPRDVLPTMSSDLWPTLYLDDRARDGWWVAEHDVVDALLALASGPFPTATMVLSGRRLWQTGELLREAAMLHRRWEAGQHGAFSAEVLAEPQRPPVQVRAVTSVEDEPDLAPLHDLMLTRRQEGWRPQMTVREALMHHLALLESIKRT